MAIRIRELEPGDREFVLSLVSRFSSIDLPSWRNPEEIDRGNREQLSEALEVALARRREQQILVAVDDQEEARAGFVFFRREKDFFSGEDYCYVSDLAVAEGFEGQGVGRRLLEAAESWGRERGYRLLTLNVFAGNIRAQRLYERSGFERELVKLVKVLR